MIRRREFLLGALSTASILFFPISGFASGRNAHKSVTIVHFNDVHGWVGESEVGIGYPKIAGFIEHMRSSNSDILVLDAGDTFNGNAYAGFDKGESIAAIVNSMGITAACAGNADFALGVPRLQELEKKLNFPLLGGNLLDEGKPVLPGFVLHTLPSGVRVGIIGVTAKNGAQVAGLTYENPVDTVKPLIKKLRPKVDLLIGLLHLGDSEQEKDTSVRLAQETSGFDVLIDGHSHTVLKNGRHENGVLIAQAGEYSKYIGVVNIVLAPSGTTATARLFDQKDLVAIQEKKETAQLLQGLYDKSDAYLGQVIGETTVTLNGERADIRTKETNLGNIAADAFREKTGADMALFVGGFIGGHLQPGLIRKKDMFDIVRFNMPLYLQNCTGSEIIAALERGLKNFPEQSGSFPQVSGIKITFAPSRNPGERVVSVITAKGKELALKKMYTVAAPYMINDGLPPKSNNNTLWSQDVIEEYITQHSPLVAVEGGRILPV